MMEINQASFHIKNCLPFQNSNYLLVAKYKLFDFGIEEKNYVYNLTNNRLLELEDGFKEVLYSTNDYFIYSVLDSNTGTFLYKLSDNSKRIVGQRNYRIDGDIIFLLINNRVVEFDNRLNPISTLENTNESFFRIEDTVEYWNDDYPFQKFDIVKCKAMNTNLIYKDRSNQRLFVHDFTNKKEVKIYAPKIKAEEKIIDAICFNNMCYILTGKNNRFEIKVFSEVATLLDDISIRGNNPFFKTTCDKLLVVYGDYSNWTKEQKKAYPEFETGNSSYVTFFKIGQVSY